jgi:hypothetical protein
MGKSGTQEQQNVNNNTYDHVCSSQPDTARIPWVNVDGDKKIRVTGHYRYLEPPILGVQSRLRAKRRHPDCVWMKTGKSAGHSPARQVFFPRMLSSTSS